MCFAGERRSDRTSTIRIVFYLFGSIAGFRPSLRWLRSSGRKPSFAGTVLGFGGIGVNWTWVPDADRRAKLLICLGVKRSLLDAYSHPNPVKRSKTDIPTLLSADIFTLRLHSGFADQMLWNVDIRFAPPV